MTAALFDDGSRGATISEDGVYRYDLWRRWDDGPLQAWIMLNPSIADADVDDKTMRRVIGFAKRDGHAGVIVRNLFAFRSPYPRDLKTAADPIGPENDDWLARLAADRFGVRQIVAAWGASGPRQIAAERIHYVLDLLSGRQLVQLDVPGLEAPHPLYRAGDLPFAPYRGAQP